MSSETKLMLGIAGGLAAGLLIGYFTAPEKGSETRKKILEQSGKWTDTIAKLFKHSEDGELHEQSSSKTEQAAV